MVQNEGHSAANKAGNEAEKSLREHEAKICPQCGWAPKSVEEFLIGLGITQEMISKLKGEIQNQNLDVEAYLNAVREYLPSGNKIRRYFKENPAKVAAGFAAMAIGAGLFWSVAHDAHTEELDRSRQFELNRALAGPKYRLDEVLSELGVAI